MPGADLAECIGADQKREGAKPAFQQFSNRENGVTALGSFFDTRDLEADVTRARKLNHSDPINIWRHDVSAFLVRRICGGHKQNSCQIEAVRRRPRDLEMCIVNRIECTAEQRGARREGQ